jgi:cullin 1
MISEVVRRWGDHQIMRKWMYDFFRYLDRFYVKRHGKKSLNEVAIQRFRTLIFDKCKSKLTAAVLEMIRKDRNGEEVDRSMLHTCVQIYVDMGLGSMRAYQNEFEKPFLDASREYYAREASSWIATDSCPEYLKKCDGRFKQEKKRVQDYLIQNTEVALLNVSATNLQSRLREERGHLLSSIFPCVSLCRP